MPRACGRGPSTIPTANAGHTADDYTTIYTYDLVGNRKLQTLDPSNDGSIDQTTAFTYNDDNQLTDQLVTGPGGATFSDTTSLYPTAGSLESETVATRWRDHD